MGHVEGPRLVLAQGDAFEGGCPVFGEGFFNARQGPSDAEGVGHVGRILGGVSQFPLQSEEWGVERPFKSFLNGAAAPAPATGHHGVGKLVAGVGNYLAGGNALGYRGSQGEDFEGGAGLQGGVSIVPPIAVVTAKVGANRTGFWFHGHRGHPHVFPLFGQLGIDHVDGGVLGFHVDSSGDLQTPGLDFAFVNTKIAQLGKHLIFNEPIGPGNFGRLFGGGSRVDGFGVGLGSPVGGAEPAFFGHAVEHIPPAFLGLGEVVSGVKLAGPLDTSRQHGCLAGVEFLDGNAEVGAGGGVDAVSVAPKVNGVEVGAEHFFFAPLVGHFHGIH